MINLRKYKYVVIADGNTEKYKPNVIACETLYDAQQAFEQGIKKNLNPHIIEIDEYLSNSVLDRYADHGEMPESVNQAYEDRQSAVKSLYEKIKNGI